MTTGSPVVWSVWRDRGSESGGPHRTFLPRNPLSTNKRRGEESSVEVSDDNPERKYDHSTTDEWSWNYKKEHSVFTVLVPRKICNKLTLRNTIFIILLTLLVSLLTQVTCQWLTRTLDRYTDRDTSVSSCLPGLRTGCSNGRSTLLTYENDLLSQFIVLFHHVLNLGFTHYDTLSITISSNPKHAVPSIYTRTRLSIPVLLKISYLL